MHTVLLSQNTAHPVPLKLRELLSRHTETPVLIELERAESYLTHIPATRLLVVLSPAPDRALQVLLRIRSLVSGPILAVGPTTDPKLILRALNEGANHYLDEAELDNQLETLLSKLNTRDEPLPTATGRVVTLLGASGGSGTSTLAVNLAAVLARDVSRCALVDLHPGAGDLAALLDLRPAHSLASLCVKASQMDQAMVESALAVHSCGVALLAPPARYAEIPLVSPHGVHKILSILRQSYPFTVVDLEDCFHEEQVTALRQSDSILVVFRPDFTSLRNIRRLLAHLDQLSLPRDRIHLILNRCGQAKELPAEEVEQALGLRVAHFVPDDPKTVNGANNTGVPVVLKASGAKVSQVISDMARSVNPNLDGDGRSSRSAFTRRAGSWLGFR